MAHFFICPGAQKSATTWLHETLVAHPDFWMPPLKELDYLGDQDDPIIRPQQIARYEAIKDKIHPDNKSWWELFASTRSLEKYSKLVRSEKISGDISPNYTFIEEAARNARRLTPDAIIIIILRDPVDRAWSHARMMAKIHGIDLQDTEWLTNFAISKEAQIMGDYPKLVENWREYFGNAVKLFRYEDLISDPIRGINKIISLFKATPVDSNFTQALVNTNYGPPAEIQNREKISDNHLAAIRFYNEELYI